MGLLWVLAGCGDHGGGQVETDGQESGIQVTSGPSTSGPKLDLAADSSGGVGCQGMDQGGCQGIIDLLFVIDNSGSMSEEQLNLARNMPLLVRQLEMLEDGQGNPIAADVNVMVTTTDMGNNLCTPFYHPGRSPESGAPIATACTDRLDRFTSITNPPSVEENACTDVCPDPIAPDADYINFSPAGTNVPDAPPADVNGDGQDDSNIAQALACVGPQGIDGCGYESPLDAMAAALDPAAGWNGGSGFLRDGGLLAVAVVTDEADCSIADASIMSDAQYQEPNPDNGMPTPTSAICWNAGVNCTGQNGGVYDDCESTGDKLKPVQDYIDLLRGQGRPVVMLGILGVPLVTEHSEDAPFEPVAGGVADLVYRDWQDPDWDNGGDVLPDEWTSGITAAHKQATFGIGPGCTGEDGMGGFTGQAIPPVRVKEVCEALDVADDPATPDDETQVRCCIESICDTDFSAAIRCLTGLISETVVPEQ